jgi:thiamine-phosphate pyrophosphorylase
MPQPALDDARLYLCTGARRAEGDLPEFLDAVLAGGVDVIQLREKNLEAAEELELLALFAEACRRHGALLAVNDRADIAVAAQADVVHVGQRDLSPSVVRRIVGPSVAIGLSSHSAAEAQAASEAPEVGYFCVGPIWATPTKPGRPHTGLGLIRATAERAPQRPWFAIGGIEEANLDEVLTAGATRVVVVRAITEAADPAAAATRIKDRLTARLAARSAG